MGKAEFTFNGTTTPQVFMPIPGITTYNFVVIGAAGGLGGLGGDGEVGQVSEGGNGGKGAVVTTTYTNITQPISIVIGGAGEVGAVYDGPAGGGGLTQVFNNAINIIAGGGGGGGAGGSNIGNNGGKGGNGGVQGENGSSSVGGSSGGVGGSITGTGGGNGGRFNSNGNGFNASADIVNTGGGGGGAGINGITGSGGGSGKVSEEGNSIGGSGGVNGGGGGYSTADSPPLSYGGGGGAAGYGGGGGGTDNNGGGGGGGGSSIVLLGGQNTLYTSAPYKDLIYGSDDFGRGHGYVLIYWNDIASNICFPSGTPVRTDQGIIPIEKINTDIHTINRQTIKHITQTVTHDKYLIHFQSNSIGHNMPDKPTTMSKDHKILYNGNLVPAFRFLDLTDKVKKIKYSGEILYNVLLHDYSLITVNNMKCETLHPENAVAKLYLN
jgi:hypothetical protein